MQTDQETEFEDYDGFKYTMEGDRLYETDGTYPDAFSVKDWKVDGTVVAGTSPAGATYCDWNCPGGGYARGYVSAVTASPFGETNVQSALKPVWKKPFQLTCTLTETC